MCVNMVSISVPKDLNDRNDNIELVREAGVVDMDSAAFPVHFEHYPSRPNN